MTLHQFFNTVCRETIDKVLPTMQCQKLGKIFTGPTYKLFLSFTTISDIYMSFISNKTTFT